MDVKSRNYLTYPLFWLLCISPLFGQVKNTTQSFTVSGKVKNVRTFTTAGLRKWKTISLGEINTSCSPRNKETTKSVKAVVLKQVLDSVQFDYDSPKELLSYYFKLVSADGYTLVFSFSEIYNTETGNKLFLVVEKDGQPIEDIQNSLLVLSTGDIKIGSRNMKWLEKIVVCKAD